MKDSFSPALPLLSIWRLLWLSPALLLCRDPLRTHGCTNTRRWWSYKGDDTRKRASMGPLDGQVTHLPQWRGEPTAAAAAASPPSSCVRPSALRTRKVFTAMDRPPWAHPQCSTPRPHDQNLPSVSTWHGDVGALLRSTLLLPRRGWV